MRKLAAWRAWRRRTCGALLVLACLAMAAPRAEAQNPDALWDIVHGQCLPGMQAHASAAPCTAVALGDGVERGYAALKDRLGIAQYLLIPTARITGIEDPRLLASGMPNYFDAAWRIRTLVQARLPRELPRDGFSLAINSAFGRTQNQLHIHVDCVRADVRDALRDNAQQIDEAWAPFGPRLAGQRYLARRIAAQDLAAADPFLLLAEGVAGARQAMGRYTLVVVGMDLAGEGPGFVLLAGRADPAAANPGSGEALQDHDCAIAR